MPDKPFRPMLAFPDTPEDLRAYEVHLPLLGSYKLDGIRAVKKGGRLVSRTLKPSPSAYAQTLALEPYEHFDGELLIKPRELLEGQTVYSETYSAVMTHSCQEPLDWWIFDYSAVELNLPYLLRMPHYQSILERHPHPDIKILEQRWLNTIEEIAAMEKEALDNAYEGLIVRRPDAPYHCNRSSWKQGYLMKIVRTLSSEAEVVGITEMMHNENEAVIDARGFTKRSTHKANKTGSGMMGALLSHDIHGLFGDNIWKCGIGEGVDHAFREDVMRNWPRDKGKIFTYTFKPYGTKDAPRQPKFKWWRDPSDIGVPT